MFLNRLIPWLTAIIVFVGFELLIIYPRQIFWLIPLMIFILFFGVWTLAGRKFFKLKFWNFLITPMLLLNSSWLFYIFLESKWIRHFFAIVLAILLLMFLEMVFVYFHSRPHYQAHALENISSYLNLTSVFLFFSSIFSLLIFLSFPLLLLSLVSIIVVAILTYQIFWASEIVFSSSRVYIIITTLIITELFLAISFLPTSVYVNSLLITIVYYLISGLSRNWLMDIKDSKVIKRYLINSAISFIIILLTAKWI